jgi:crotonobetaine/carnitine-CoA ligase
MWFAGYHDQPALTAAATEAGWYRTGDSFVQRDDGALRFVDRLRDTIRRFGENISATALEAAVLELADVAECAVMGVPSALTGQEVLLVAVPRHGCTLEPARLAAELAERLPQHMQPRHIAVVPDLPKAPSGKVHKASLVAGELLAQAWTAPSRPDRSGGG